MRRLAIVWALMAIPSATFAQSSSLSPAASWAAQAANQYQVFPNLTYLTASNVDVKLDIYARRGATTPQPTVIYMHGGFWAAGSKEGSLMSLLPWMEMGWTVVNVEYRLARVALVPAAVEDCLCALRYVAAQAKTYNIDTARIVLTGESAGGHLALTTGMIPESAGLARECAGNTPMPRVAAMINWFGITDVADVVDGPHAANLAVTWLGSLPNKDEIARRVSPRVSREQRIGCGPVVVRWGQRQEDVASGLSRMEREASWCRGCIWDPMGCCCCTRSSSPSCSPC